MSNTGFERGGTSPEHDEQVYERTSSKKIDTNCQFYPSNEDKFDNKPRSPPRDDDPDYEPTSSSDHDEPSYDNEPLTPGRYNSNNKPTSRPKEDDSGHKPTHPSKRDDSNCQPHTHDTVDSESQPSPTHGNEWDDQLSSDDEDDSHSQSSSDDGDDSEDKTRSTPEAVGFDNDPRRARRRNSDVDFDQGSVSLNQHDLGADTDLEVGTVISIGNTLQLYDDSFLHVTGIGRSKNSQSVRFLGSLFRRIEEFQLYLPVTSSGSELIWLCEGKEHQSKPESYLREATSREVLRIRYLVRFNPESVSESVSENSRPLFCQWVLEAELSEWHTTGTDRSFRSILKGSKRRSKAFIALCSDEFSDGGNKDSNMPSQHTDSHIPKDNSYPGPYQPRVHERGHKTMSGQGQDRYRGALGHFVLTPNTHSDRIANGRYGPAIRKASHHHTPSFASLPGKSSAQRLASKPSIEPRIYTFADAFCGAGGMSIGANDAGLRIRSAFDKNEDAVNTYYWNHGDRICKKISAIKLLVLPPGNRYERSPVDILHLSPPYQGFSQAARGRPRNGDENNSCMNYVHDIVRKVKPRIVTFEQVKDVLSSKKGFFTTMVHGLTSIGYSVRWEILNCVDFGVPQKRRRLFMIASW